MEIPDCSLKVFLRSLNFFYLKIGSSEINDISGYCFYNVGSINFEWTVGVSEQPANSFFISEDGGGNFYQLQAPHSKRSVVLSS